MGNRRTLIVIAAVVVAAVAAFANYSYLSTTQDRANKGAERVQVYVVKQDVPKGLPGEQAIEQKYVDRSAIPKEFRPVTALNDVATIRGKVALANLAAGQVVVDGMFVDPKAAQVTFAQRIPPGQVAITVSVDQTRGVAGLLVPGDLVNILVNVEGTQRYLMQNVKVLAIGQTAAPEAGETSTAANSAELGGLITFAVPPTAASKLALAASSGLYLTLVPPDNNPVNIPPVNLGNLFSGGLTPE